MKSAPWAATAGVTGVSRAEPRRAGLTAFGDHVAAVQVLVDVLEASATRSSGITSSVGSGSVTPGALPGLQPAGHPHRPGRRRRRACTVGAQPRTTSMAGAAAHADDAGPHTATGSPPTRRACRAAPGRRRRASTRAASGRRGRPAGPRRCRGRAGRRSSPSRAAPAGADQEFVWSSRPGCQAPYCHSPSSTAVASPASPVRAEPAWWREKGTDHQIRLRAATRDARPAATRSRRRHRRGRGARVPGY